MGPRSCVVVTLSLKLKLLRGRDPLRLLACCARHNMRNESAQTEISSADASGYGKIACKAKVDAKNNRYGGR